MNCGLKNEDGFSLIFTMIISVILSSTILAVFLYLSVHQHLIYRKANFLKAKYCARGGLNLKIIELENENSIQDWTLSINQCIYLSPRDSCMVSTKRWGGFLHMLSKSCKKDQSYSLRSIWGIVSTEFYNPAIVVNPFSETLVISGETQIWGDVYTGLSGLRKGSLSGLAYRGNRLVFGKIIKSEKDNRPQIDRLYIKQIFHDWRKFFTLPAQKFSDFIHENCDVINPASPENANIIILSVDNEEINRRNWHLKGPAVLIAKEKLNIQCSLRIENFVQILCEKSITLSGNSILSDVILYSPDSIRIKKTGSFEGQIFSEKSIGFDQNVRIDLPSLFLVYSEFNNGYINIKPHAAVNGWFYYTSPHRAEAPGAVQANILISENSTVTGLVYCDDFTAISGTVNGIIITDRFLLEDPPSKYINWIKDGHINRDKLPKKFTLPVFMKNTNFSMLPLKFL